MIGDTFPLTYKTVAKTLLKINQDNYSATYFLAEALIEFKVTISHTIPKKGGTGESHLVRLDIIEYDADGVVLSERATWTVIKTFFGRQHVDTDGTADAILGWMTPANVDKIVARES